MSCEVAVTVSQGPVSQNMLLPQEPGSQGGQPHMCVPVRAHQQASLPQARYGQSPSSEPATAISERSIYTWGPHLPFHLYLVLN